MPNFCFQLKRQKASPVPSAIAAVRLLLFAGCRRGEILKLKWEHVDLADQAIRLPDSKTGAKVVHLGSAAISVLQAIDKANGSPFAIVGRNPVAHLTVLQPFWLRLRGLSGRAGLKRCADPRSSSHVYLRGSERQSKLANDRKAAWPYPGVVDRALRPPRKPASY